MSSSRLTFTTFRCKTSNPRTVNLMSGHTSKSPHRATVDGTFFSVSTSFWSAVLVSYGARNPLILFGCCWRLQKFTDKPVSERIHVRIAVAAGASMVAGVLACSPIIDLILGLARHILRGVCW